MTSRLTEAAAMVEAWNDDERAARELIARDPAEREALLDSQERWLGALDGLAGDEPERDLDQLVREAADRDQAILGRDRYWAYVRALLERRRERRQLSE